MANNRNMKAHLDKRRRRLMEFNIAKRELCHEKEGLEWLIKSLSKLI